MGEAPVGVALVDHDQMAVVADSNRFTVPGAAASLAVVAIDPSGRMGLAGYIASGTFPRDMAVSPDGQVLLVSNFGSNQVETVDVADLLPLASR